MGNGDAVLSEEQEQSKQALWQARIHCFLSKVYLGLLSMRTTDSPKQWYECLRHTSYGAKTLSRSRVCLPIYRILSMLLILGGPPRRLQS